MLPCPIWPLAQHVEFGQNCSDGSIGSDVLFCIDTACREPSHFSSFSPHFSSYCGCTSRLYSGEIGPFLSWRGWLLMGIERTARGNSKERNDPDNYTKTAHLKLGFTEVPLC